MDKAIRIMAFVFILTIFFSGCRTTPGDSLERNSSQNVAGKALSSREPWVINSNGGWCWFEDPRVIVDEENGLLIAGTVKSPQGDIDITIVDLEKRKSFVVTLSPAFQSDDHNSPALLKLQNGHFLAMWSAHDARSPIPSREEAMKVRWRISKNPNDPYQWEPENTWMGDTGVTYSNLFQLPDGTIFDFHRGHGFDPNFLISHDEGKSFQYGGHLLFWTQRKDGVNRGGRPYVRYAQDGSHIHLITTEDHPRNFDNSIYHAYIDKGEFFHTDGRKIGTVATQPEASIQPNHLTRIFQGDTRNVAWTVDLEIDENDYPYAAFSVQKDDQGKPTDKESPEESGWDLRYYYAKWDGTQWNVYHIAYAGTRLYGAEADYSGLVALHPHNPDILFISTNADPVSGKPLISSNDGKRHYEIFKGKTNDNGVSWDWSNITANSTQDNIRPIVPKWNANRTALLWLRGQYNTFRDYNMEVVLQILSD